MNWEGLSNGNPDNEIVEYQVWEFVDGASPWQCQLKFFKKSIVIELREECPLLILKSYLKLPRAFKSKYCEFIYGFFLHYSLVLKNFFSLENTHSVKKDSGVDSGHSVRRKGGDGFSIIIDWVNCHFQEMGVWGRGEY